MIKTNQIKSVVIIDEIPIIKSAIKQLFEAESISAKIAGYADNGVDGLSIIRVLTPDVIVLDVDILYIDTFDLIKRIRENNKKTIVIVFGILKSSHITNRLIATGANACIDKRWNLEDCSLAFKSILSPYVVDKSRAIRLQNTHIPNRSDHDKLDSLSTRELLILKHLAQGERNIDIAKRYTLSDKTISTYKQRITKKLNIKTMFELREYVIKNKLI
ncbi:response regulator [Aeromonas lacus]